MKREDGESIFLRYRNGTPYRVQMDIIQKISFFLEKNNHTDNPIEVLRDLILPINDGMGLGLSINSTWFRLIEECYLIFNTDLCRNKFNYSLLNKICVFLLSHKNIDEKWLNIKNFMIDNIDHFSMWEYSYNKMLAERRPIQRQEDGTYIGYIENQIHIINGAKSFEEEKFDYIMSTTLSEYGSVYNLLKFISIVFISIDYKEKPDIYPHSLSIIMPESDNTYWFLRWKWSLERLYGYMKSGWRPHNNHCDPDWLASDLLADYSEDILLMREMKKFDLPDDIITQQYEEAFKNYPYQYACAIDTDLRIGEADEVYFNFKGRKIRWINGKTYLRSVVVVPTKDLNNLVEEENILNEFISSLVWETEIPIIKIFQAGAAKRFLPIVSSVKNMGGIDLGIPKLNFNGNNSVEKETLALALYKEGINSKSVYYSFLNFYKIIELLLGGKKHDIIRLINQSRELLISRGHYTRVNEIDRFDEDFGEYIYVSCRCAVAHAGQIDNTVNPDNIDDYKRITKDLPLIKEIAKDIIKSGDLV